MPKKTPSYRQRAGYNQAIVTLTDSATGFRKDYWLGVYGSSTSRERYHRLIAEWESNGRRLPDPNIVVEGALRSGEVSVAHLIRDYWRWAQGHYERAHCTHIKLLLRLLREQYGTSSAASFGPKKLRLLREAMVRGDAAASPPRRSWSRKYIKQLGHHRNHRALS